MCARRPNLASIDEKTLLQVFEGVPQAEITKDQLSATSSVTDLLSEVTDGLVFPSKGEARRMIKGGGVSINKQKVLDAEEAPSKELLHCGCCCRNSSRIKADIPS